MSAEIWKTSEFRKNFLEFVEETKTNGPCDKCGGPVDPWNNAAIFEWLNHVGTDWMSPLYLNRHIEPVVDEQNIVICPGSPSRWQKIGGFPDERPEYHQDPNSRQGKHDGFWAEKIWNYMQSLKPATQLAHQLPSEVSH